MDQPDHVHINLSADCGSCVALCCVAFAFDKSSQFAFDKRAGIACPNLDNCGQCTIHSHLDTKGFPGCVTYDCLGAGQRVTQEIFSGQSWQDEPKLLKPMMNAFRSMREIHEELALLATAKNLDLPKDKLTELGQLVSALSPEAGWTEDSLSGFEQSKIGTKVRKFLSSLRKFVSRD